MYYVINSEGFIQQKMLVSEDTQVAIYQNIFKDCQLVESEEDFDIHTYKYVEGAFIPLTLSDEDFKLSKVPADKFTINNIREELDSEPLLVNGLLLDIDSLSERRLADIVATGVDDVWRTADNREVELTASELSQLLVNMRVKRGERSRKLYNLAQSFKAQIKSLSMLDIQKDKWLVPH